MSAPAGAHDPAIEASAARLREALGPRATPRVALLLGSGWGAVADAVQDRVDVDYAQLPAFPTLAVGGHTGRVRLGTLGGRMVAVLLGRAHPYESGEAHAMRGAVRTLARLGCRVLVQTNAAGSLDAAMPPGRIMVLSDHLNLPQRSPLVHERDDSRFVDLRDAYDPALRAHARRCAHALGLALDEGVYAWVMGPQFETPAEIRMLRLLGAHAVGMSTVPETILARHAGLRVLALSLVTNLACGVGDEALSHAHTLQAAARASADASALLQTIVAGLDEPA
ncbi:MAG: purine-nucleoside phosphorylase [Rubrivivax sp.]